jgi:hypothetical protein
MNFLNKCEALEDFLWAWWLTPIINPCYWEGGDQEDCGLRQPGQNVCKTPISNNKKASLGDANISSQLFGRCK